MTDRLTELTVEIVSSFVVGNRVASGDLPLLITSIREALAAAQAPARTAPEIAPIVKATAAQIRNSVTPDHVISFEDGKPYKTLKRHLSKRGMTIAEYKAKWGLPKDYPTAAPNYSAKRSELAKASGLGRKAIAPVEIAPEPERPRRRKAAGAK